MFRGMMHGYARRWLRPAPAAAAAAVAAVHTPIAVSRSAQQHRSRSTLSYAVGPKDPPVREVTIGGLLQAAADEAPDRIALAVAAPPGNPARTWTYRALLDDARQAARALLSKFEPGERVVLCAPNIPEWVILQYGCALSGVVLTTANPTFTVGELEYVCDQSQAAGLFVSRECRGNPLLAHAEHIHSGPCSKHLRELVCFDVDGDSADLHGGDGGANVLSASHGSSWRAFMEHGSAAAAEGGRGLPEVRPLDAAMLLYTSGTTGFPKGALLHHRGLANNAAHAAQRKGMPHHALCAGFMPLFHTGGVCTVLMSAVAHGTLLLFESFDAGLVLSQMLAHRERDVTFIGVPTMLVAMFEHPLFEPRSFTHVRALFSGGSMVPAAMIERAEREFRNADFTVVFGQTECSPISSMTHTHDAIEDKATTVGTPMPGVEVKIVDTVSGETLPVGEVGEYLTRGYHVMLGYFRMPHKTAEAIDADGWLHTGDLCRMDARGYCTIEGRAKEMIIRGGQNIYPQEIEGHLFRHETVSEIAVVGVPDDKWGETVAAVVRAAPGQWPSAVQLRDHLKGLIAPYKMPRSWYVIDEFPLTGSGKVQKFRLVEMIQGGECSPLWQ
jgi:fatty-acyl-CoA synthase